MAGTTPNRSYPYPEDTDTFDPTGDMEALAVAIDTDVDGLVSVANTNDPGAVQAGFTVWANGARGDLALDGKLVQVWLDLNNSSTLTATSGNLSDVTAYIVDAAYRPDADHYVPFNFQTGAIQGSGQLFPDGSVSLQAATGNVASGSHIRIQIVFLKA